MSNKWTCAVLRVGGGRGFVVERRVRRAVTERIIITAAHCLPRLPPSITYEGERTYRARTYKALLGPLGCQKLMVWARCLFVDPATDVAVLGRPDGQTFGNEAKTYDELVDAMAFLHLGKARASTRAVRVLSLTGRWVRGRATRHKDGQVWREMVAGRWTERRAKDHMSVWREGRTLANLFTRGMSGSPILSLAGEAIGVVSCDMWNPALADVLPAGLLRQIIHRGGRR